MANIFSRVWDAVFGVGDLVDSWAKEPLKVWEHERHVADELRAHEHDKDLKRLEVELETEKIVAVERERTEIELHKQRVLDELDQLAAEKELENRKEYVELLLFAKNMTLKISLDYADAIGRLHPELTANASNVLNEQVRLFDEQKKIMRKDIMDEYRQIAIDFVDDDEAKKAFQDIALMSLRNYLELVFDMQKRLNATFTSITDTIIVIVEKAKTQLEAPLDVPLYIGSGLKRDIGDTKYIEQSRTLIEKNGN